MSSTTTPSNDAKSASGISQVQVEERRLGLHDFLKTLVKVNGSDLHLQEGSVPMIRVDGRARFLDCPAPDGAAMAEFVGMIIHDPEKKEVLDTRGAVDASYPAVDLGARFRVNVFYSR